MPESRDDKGWSRVKGALAGRRARVDARATEILRLRGPGGKYARKYKTAKERITRLEQKISETSMVHKEVLEKRDERIRVMEDELARTRELLSARTKELTGAQSFLSTKDHVSEAEVLGIVRNLNENVFQVAGSLAEGWEKLASSQSEKFVIPQKTIDSFSQFYGSTLIDRALRHDFAALTFLVQSCLCRLVTRITLSWRRRCHEEEQKILRSVYERLSASGEPHNAFSTKRTLRVLLEIQPISARWRSLTHGYLTKPSPDDSTRSIMQSVANILWITGSFQSTQHSFDFVRAKASNRIGVISQLAHRLESVFMVDVKSSDMYLLFECPRTPFNNNRMTREFESAESSSIQARDKVAGTTEVGVGKSVCGGGVELRMEILLRAKVILENDLEGP